jgi:hypothetical protein
MSSTRRMVLRSTGTDPGTTSPATGISQPELSYFDASDTDDPAHKDHGTASLSTLLDVCLHLDSLKPQIEDFLLNNGIHNIFDFSGIVPDDVPAMMTRKRKETSTVDIIELVEDSEIVLPGVVARAVKVLLWYIHQYLCSSNLNYQIYSRGWNYFFP